MTALLDRPLTELTVGELMALKAEFAARGIAIYNSVSPEMVFLIGLGIIYSKAFMETLGKNHAEAPSEAVRTQLRKKGETRELLVGPDDAAAATLVITSDTPDEARLAVLDLASNARLPGRVHDLRSHRTAPAPATLRQPAYRRGPATRQRSCTSRCRTNRTDDPTQIER